MTNFKAPWFMGHDALQSVVAPPPGGSIEELPWVDGSLNVLDFDPSLPWVKQLVMGLNSVFGSLGFTTANLAPGRRVTCLVYLQDASVNLTLPGQWTFVGVPTPTTADPPFHFLLSLISFGTTDADVVGTWVQASF